MLCLRFYAAIDAAERHVTLRHDAAADISLVCRYAALRFDTLMFFATRFRPRLRRAAHTLRATLRCHTLIDA